MKYHNHMGDRETEGCDQFFLDQYYGSLMNTLHLSEEHVLEDDITGGWVEG